MKSGLGTDEILGIWTRIRITMITVVRVHHALESVAFHDFSVHKKERRVDPQRVSRHTGQSLNVKRLASFRIARNSGDIIRSENKNITTMRLDEVVGEL